MKSCQILISLNIHTGLVPLKRKNMPQNIIEVGWALSPPQLINAHDQANLQQTQLKKHTGAWKAFGWISSQTSALSEKPPTACALLTVTQWHCHCFHAQHLSGYKYLGISRKQYYGTKNIQDISSFEVLMEKQCKTITLGSIFLKSDGSMNQNPSMTAAFYASPSQWNKNWQEHIKLVHPKSKGRWNLKHL